ncbi:MAG: hypothetical protein E6R04_07965 [Spirochaetes bacterium]|nr:MAG: hypothetical protein E6R04_07965 [Spirochaetota bacterium]
MANHVSSIIANAKSLAATELGATWHELKYAFELEKNDSRISAKGYSVIPLSADPVDTVLRSYSLQHGFQLILSDTIARGAGDAEVFTVLGTLYDKADEIFKDYAGLLLNLAGTVIRVFDPSLGEPEFFNDRETVVLRMNFNVLYRQNIS